MQRGNHPLTGQTGCKKVGQKHMWRWECMKLSSLRHAYTPLIKKPNILERLMRQRQGDTAWMDGVAPPKPDLLDNHESIT